MGTTCLKMITTSLLASSGFDSKLRIFDITSGSVVHIYTIATQTQYPYYALDLFTSSTLLRGNLGDRTVKFIDYTTGTVKGTITVSNIIDIYASASVGVNSERIFTCNYTLTSIQPKNNKTTPKLNRK